MTEQVHHPIFARLYEGIASRADRRGADEHRRKLLSGLVGRVIEVGAGNGARNQVQRGWALYKYVVYKRDGRVFHRAPRRVVEKECGG